MRRAIRGYLLCRLGVNGGFGAGFGSFLWRHRVYVLAVVFKVGTGKVQHVFSTENRHKPLTGRAHGQETRLAVQAIVVTDRPDPQRRAAF
jgi:hypothetical protein